MANRNGFDKELKNLNVKVIEMASLIQNSFDKTIKALDEINVDLANEVLNDDDKIDEMESMIETECIKLIYSQQPVAKDLRIIASILKLITDLERIGDNCSDISEYIINITKYENNAKPLDIIAMSKKVKEMFSSTINCFINLDIEKALLIIKDDDIVDKYFEDIILEIQNNIKENIQTLENGTNYILIVKYLERMADHCCNICEWIAYRISGIHNSHI